MRKTFYHRNDLPKLEQLKDEIVEGRRFYIAPSGARLPSVTTVLSYSKGDGLQKWVDRVGEETAEKIKFLAAARGTDFHSMMERYLKNEDNIFEGLMPDMRMSFRDARLVVDRIDNIHYIESPLYSERLGIAGRTDVIAEFDGVPSIIDFKTSSKFKKESWIQSYFEQGTAYALMYEELTNIYIDQIVIIISVEGEGDPQLFIKNRNNYIDSLHRKIQHYMKENAT